MALGPWPLALRLVRPCTCTFCFCPFLYLLCTKEDCQRGLQEGFRSKAAFHNGCRSQTSCKGVEPLVFSTRAPWETRVMAEANYLDPRFIHSRTIVDVGSPGPTFRAHARSTLPADDGEPQVTVAIFDTQVLHLRGIPVYHDRGVNVIGFYNVGIDC